MSDSEMKKQKAMILWVSGLPLADVSAIAEVETLVEQGVKVELLPSLITGLQWQYYQAASGKAPASFGFFDTLMPLYQLSRSSNGQSGYTIVEEHSGRDAAPRSFPNSLRAAGWSVRYEEVTLSELAASVERLTAGTNAASCVVIKSNLDGQPVTTAVADSISQALHLARAWVGESGLLALLSDAQRAPVKRFVNVNNFLADMGVIERGEEKGEINWSNSLAYFAGHGQLWVNLLGRDPQGAVHPQDEYEEVRDTLVKTLPMKLRDRETGEPVVERVLRKEELYAGDYLFCAPDLVIQFMPGYAPSPRSTRLDFDDDTYTTPAPGTTAIAGMNPHQVKGYLLATAPAFAAGRSVTGAAPLVSLAPTLLHALGVEYVDMDDSAIGELFMPTFLETHPIRSSAQSQELSEEDEELVINRLRDLGYI
jgi:hypothetical protein